MALVTLYLFYPPLNAQISQGGLPYSFTHTAGDSIPTITLPFMNVNSLIQAEEIDTTIRSYKYGFVNDININVNEYGDWENQPDSSRIWRIKIISPSAVSINLTFNQFFLPEGCELFIYTEDQNTILGAFTTLNNSDTNTFATSMLIGNTSIVELFEPFTNWGQTQLEISRVISGFREFNRDCGSSYQCQENINCGMGLEWYDQKRSVVMYTIPNGGTCTGTLINNVYNENLQFLITANHCLSSYDPN